MQVGVGSVVPVPLSGMGDTNFWDAINQALSPLAQAGAIRLATSDLPAGTSVVTTPGGGIQIGSGYPVIPSGSSAGSGILLLAAAVVGFMLLSGGGHRR